MAERGNHEILLETGTNEIEIMEFTIDGNLYGINVAKVREILMSAPVHPMPHSHPAVEGIFKPRDIVITVVDLPKYLSGREEEKGNKDLFIITNFNQMHIAFRVHTVVGISRISWQDIQKPDKTVSGGPEGVATGIAQCGEELVTILDFEKIVAGLVPHSMVPVLLDRLEVPAGLKANSVTKAQRRALEELLKGFTVSVTGPRPVAEAIVTSGGVQVSQVQPSTMESKLAPGLYFAGEILDVDAYTGGFNLQIAWSTGMLAGRSAE